MKVPSPTGGYTHIGDSIIYVGASLFGATVGASIGVFGPVVADILVGYPRWYVTIVAHGLQGYIAGLGMKKSFGVKILLMAVGGFVMSITYFVVNIFIKGFGPAVLSFIRDLLGQTTVSILVAIPIVKGLEKNPVVEKVAELLGGTKTE